MSDSLDKWKIFQDLSIELKRNIRLAVVFEGSAIYVTKDDEVFGFGINQEGCLGTGDREPRTEHTKIEQLCGQNIQGLQFSNWTYFAISASGSVFAWGNNEYGQLGLGTKENTLIPTKIGGTLGTKRVLQVTCSDGHTLVLTSDREVLAWGKNEDGILGHGEDVNEQQKIPCQVPGLEGIAITRIVCGMNHALVLSSDGKVYSWGWNKFGQLGNGRTDEHSHQPTLISGNIGRIRDLAAHFESNVCAVVTEADEVYVWGNFNGQFILRPTKTSFITLDEVFAKLPISALTFRPLLPKPIEENNTANKSYGWLKKSFDDPDTADVVFVVEGKKIHTHKAILIMQCAVFKTMFQGDWKESHEREQIIEHHSYDVFFAFLKYFYTNEVDLQPDLALELFALAHFYQLTDVQKECLKIIKRGLTVENAASIYDKAIQLAAEELEEFVFNFCMKHMNAVLKSDGFKLLKDNVVRDFVLRAAQQDAFKK